MILSAPEGHFEDPASTMGSELDKRQATRLGRPRTAAREGAAEVGGDLTHVGPYRVVGRLGQGGMGEVYRAEDSRLGRTVALKFLAPDLIGRDDAKSRFLREASAAAKLDHPHICTVHEIGETDDGRLYIVMACYEGESLEQRLERGPLPVEETIRIARQTAAGLAKAHRAGIVHRDVKPANVFLTDDGVKILDFGVAKVRGDAALTAAGGILGTPYYMAPEQILGDPDPRSDLWALGVVVYEMLTGERPFPGPQVMKSILEGPAPRLADRRPDAPDFLCRLVERALAKDPEKRYQSAEELALELPVTIDDASLWPTMGAVTIGGGPAARRIAGRRLAAGALVAALLAAGTVYRQRQRDAGAAAGAAAAAPAVVAVLPFTVRGGGGYDYLREGMVDLLSTKINGAGDVRAVDPRALLRRLAGDPAAAADPASGAGLARRLDADLLILGSVVEVAGQLRLDAVLYEVDAVRERARASAEGEAAEIFGLVDRLAIQLLAGMDRGSAGRMRRLATMTSESFPALKHYLDGESAWRASRAGDAARAFEAAVAADPQFALAWYRLSLARSWLIDVDAASAALARAMEHADRLAPDDRRVLEITAAFDRGDAVTAESLARELLSRRGDDLEAWAVLGEVEFHLGPAFGRSLRHSRRSWERVLELEPDDRQALLHLARVDLYDGDLAAVAVHGERLKTLLAGSERASEALSLLAMTPAGEAERRRLRDVLLGSELGIPWLTAAFSLVSSREAMEFWASLYEELLAPGRPPRERAFGHRHLGILALAAGRLAQADRHLAVASHPPEQEQEYRALAATVPFLPVEGERLRELIATVEAWPAEPQELFSVFEPHARLPAHHRLYVLALLVSRSGDAGRALVLADELAALGEVASLPGLARDLELGVRAEIAWRAGRHQEVVDLLAERHGRYTFELSLMSPLASRSRERYLKADALLRLGRPEEALAWFETLGDLDLFDLVYAAVAQLRQAEIHERLGRRERAAELYRRFLAQWRGCDPELQPRVDDMRRRLGLGG